MKTVLIVDDDKDIHLLLMTIISKHFPSSKIKYHTSNSGIEAVKLINSNFYDLIVCDIEMPNGDGIYLLEQMNKRNILVPLIYFTSDPELVSHIKNAPLKAVVNKKYPLKVIEEIEDILALKD